MSTPEALYAAARELTTTDLLPRLKALIPEQGTPLESRIGSHGKTPAAPTPWNDPAAMLFFEIAGDARRYESLLTVKLFGHAKYRPPTDAHTIACISRLPVLIAHAQEKPLEPLDLIDPITALIGWPARIRRLLDDTRPGEEAWANAPGGLVCPYCDKPLQVPPGWTKATDITLTCRRCRDADGKRYQWAPDQWLGQLQDDPDLLTETEAVDQYHLGSSTLRSWVSRDQLTPAGKRGGYRVYRRTDIATLAARMTA